MRLRWISPTFLSWVRDDPALRKRDDDELKLEHLFGRPGVRDNQLPAR
jgi:hypothetical protein